MEKKDVVKFELEDGENIEMEIVKEFEYKNKKYAVLLADELCKCDEDCHCEEDCDCEGECDDKCDCHEEGECNLCILEVTKDENGKETFTDIEDKKVFDEVVEQAEKLFYEESK